MIWVVIASALGGCLIGGSYFRAIVIVMTSAQVALFHAGLFFAGELGAGQLVLYAFASLAAHQLGYFLCFTARLFLSGDINAPNLDEAISSRGISAAIGQRFDQVAVLTSEIERRAPHVRHEAAHVGRLVKEIRLSIEERRAGVMR